MAILEAAQKAVAQSGSPWTFHRSGRAPPGEATAGASAISGEQLVETCSSHLRRSGGCLPQSCFTMQSAARPGRCHRDRLLDRLDGPRTEVQKKLVAEFNRTHPGIRVRILSVAGSYQKVKIAFATGAVPDVCSAVWSHELAGYAFRGVLEPLDGYMGFGQERTRVQCRGMEGPELRGPSVCHVCDHQFRVHRHQRSVFRQCGLDPDNPPRTILELDRAVAAVTQYADNGDFVRYGLRPPWLENGHTCSGADGTMRETGRITANDPPMSPASAGWRRTRNL